MYHVAICDDDELVETLKEILDEVKRTQEIPYIISRYRWTERKIKMKDILYNKTAKRGAQIVVCPNCKEAEIEEMLLVSDVFWPYIPQGMKRMVIITTRVQKNI